MNEIETLQVLAELELNLDSQIIGEILVLVNDPALLGLVWPLGREEVWAIGGLVCQSKRLLAVDGQTVVGPVVPLERFITRIPSACRMDVLEQMEEISSRWMGDR